MIGSQNARVKWVHAFRLSKFGISLYEPGTDVSTRLQSEMSNLASNLGQIGPKYGTNLGLFKISISTFWLEAKCTETYL